MSALFGILVLTAAMATAEPNHMFQLKRNCSHLAAQTFRRETANDEDQLTTERITALA